mmetsp:Transcript_27512/g.71405  ORF Transcript_27512/g.71405 Transcript_27512/m.71405 type:complete len:654 (-) Transcript_27512:90-2051(-)
MARREGLALLALALLASLFSAPTSQARMLRGQFYGLAACSCIAVYDPVCLRDGTEVATNEACALCDTSLDGVSYRKEWCASINGKGDKPVDGRTPTPTPTAEQPEAEEPEAEEPSIGCICPAVFRPVCLKDGSIVGSNACRARCDTDLTEAEYSEDWCPGRRDFQPIVVPDIVLPDPDGPGAPKTTPPVSEEPGCICPAVFQPVCDENGTQLASNTCMATCDPELKGVEYSEAWCQIEEFEEFSAPIPEAEDTSPNPRIDGSQILCLCGMIYDPFCDANAVELAANECEVTCKGLDFASVTRDNCYPGTPRRFQQSAPACRAECPHGGPIVCDLLGRELGSACVAACDGHTDNRLVRREYCEERGFRHLAQAVGEPTVEMSAPLGTEAGNQAPIAPTTNANTNAPPRKLCMCPLVFSPVCNSAGEEVGGNACDAVCNGHSPDTFSSSNCGRDVYVANNALPAEPVTEPQAGWFDTPCACPAGGRPVCSPDGQELAKSSCDAECDGYKSGVHFTRSWCINPRGQHTDTAAASDTAYAGTGSSVDESNYGRTDEEADTASADAYDDDEDGDGDDYGRYQGQRQGDDDGDDDGRYHGQQQGDDDDDTISRCSCPDLHAPVCDEFGEYVAANVCYARCYHMARGRTLQPCSRKQRSG